MRRASKPAEIVARWFLLLSLKACGTHAPHFWTFPIEWRCFSIAVWQHSIFSASSFAVWREFSCKSWFNRSLSNSTGRPERGASLKSKFPSLNLAYQSRAVLLAMASYPYTAFAPLEPSLKAKRRCRKCSTWHSILMFWKLTEINSNKKTKHRFRWNKTSSFA